MIKTVFPFLTASNKSKIITTGESILSKTFSTLLGNESPTYEILSTEKKLI
jgi:hypothetical protein